MLLGSINMGVYLLRLLFRGFLHRSLVFYYLLSNICRDVSRAFVTQRWGFLASLQIRMGRRWGFVHDISWDLRRTLLLLRFWGFWFIWMDLENVVDVARAIVS